MSTSTTSLRPHIEKYHLEEYLALAKQRGWNILLPGLVSQANSAAEATASQVEQPKKFNESIFHQHLLNFIIADDQVCSYQIWV